MKIAAVKIKGYRIYQEEVSISFSPVTVLIGPNGVGKSSILEALDLFFNKNGFVKDEDGSQGSEDEIEISVLFSDCKGDFVFDENEVTSFEREPYLLNKQQLLEVKKIYKRANLTVSNPAVKIHCALPQEMEQVVGANNTQLKKLVDELKIECKKTDNATMRRAIYDFYISQGAELLDLWVDIQKRYTGLETLFPQYSIFKSDRLNSSKDSEVSEPVKYAIQAAIKEASEEVETAKQRVSLKIKDILDGANKGLIAFGDDMPQFTEELSDDLTKAFFATICDKQGIPLEKQGSGIRRLYMLNLMISEATRKASENGKAHKIFAIEEPETSQHPDFQEKLISSLDKIVVSGNQILITTHNPYLLSKFSTDAIKVVQTEAPKVVDISQPGVLRKAVEKLGLLSDPLPNIQFRTLVVVEGPTDLIILNKLRENHSELDASLREAWVVLGGGDTIKDWVRAEYYCERGVPQFYFVDPDFTPTGGFGSTYHNVNKALAKMNRPDLQHLVCLKRREIEQYAHPAALKRFLSELTILTDGLDPILLKLDDKYIPANDTFNELGRFVPTGQSLTINDLINSAGCRGYSFSGANYKSLIAEKIFPIMTAEEVLERFLHIEDSGNVCELGSWSNMINQAHQ